MLVGSCAKSRNTHTFSAGFEGAERQQDCAAMSRTAVRKQMDTGACRFVCSACVHVTQQNTLILSQNSSDMIKINQSFKLF